MLTSRKICKSECSLTSPASQQQYISSEDIKFVALNQYSFLQFFSKHCTALIQHHATRAHLHTMLQGWPWKIPLQCWANKRQADCLDEGVSSRSIWTVRFRYTLVWLFILLTLPCLCCLARSLPSRQSRRARGPTSRQTWCISPMLTSMISWTRIPQLSSCSMRLVSSNCRLCAIVTIYRFS